MRKKKIALPRFSSAARKRKIIIAGIKITTVALEKKARPERKPEKNGKNRFVCFILRLKKKRLKRIKKKLEF